MKNSLSIVLPENEPLDSLALVKSNPLQIGLEDPIPDSGREFVRSDFVALQSHMESCAQSKSITKNLKILVSQAFNFFRFRLVSFACVLGIFTFIAFEVISYF